jgi:tetratricopeptide (TPR) repeat protein
MSWLSRLLGGRSDAEPKPQRLDYMNEALALERQGDFDAALTSYRLALRDKPDDAGILQNMAIAYSRTGRPEEAIRCYRRALDANPALAGAHYGLAFLLLKREDHDSAAEHLRAFLSNPPETEGAARHIAHAEETLRRLETPGGYDAPQAGV